MYIRLYFEKSHLDFLASEHDKLLKEIARLIEHGMNFSVEWLKYND